MGQAPKTNCSRCGYKYFSKFKEWPEPFTYPVVYKTTIINDRMDNIYPRIRKFWTCTHMGENGWEHTYEACERCARHHPYLLDYLSPITVQPQQTRERL